MVVATATGNGSIATAVLTAASSSGITIGFPSVPYGFSIAANDAMKAEGNSGSTAFTFTITRFGDLSTPVSVNWSTGPGNSTGTATSITNTADFNTLSGSLDFVPGQVTQTFSVLVAGDTIAETNEQFHVSINNLPLTSAPLPPDYASSAAATILNDDGVVNATYSLGWGTGGNLNPVGFFEAGDGASPTNVNFTVTRSGDVTLAGSVDWSIVGSGATPADAVDFVGGVMPGGTIQFAPGEITKTIPIPIHNDYVTEPNEGFQILLANPGAGTGIDVGTLDRTILNDDIAPGFAIVANVASVVEGQPGSTTPYSFTIYRSGDASATASVSWSAGYGFVLGAPGSAGYGDFVGGSPYPSGTANFAPGETSQTIALQVIGDLEFEYNESFAVSLSNPSAGTPILVGSANGVILNDDSDTPATFYGIAATDASKPEGNSGTTAFTFTVTRSGDLTYGGSVQWNAGLPYNPNGSPSPITSFAAGAATSGVVSFVAGQVSQEITILVAGDDIPEPDVAFNVVLGQTSSGSDILPTQGIATNTILNDDGPSQPSVFSITADIAAKAEGDSGTTDFTYTISRTGGFSEAAQVLWYTNIPASFVDPTGADYNDIVPIVVGNAASAGSITSVPYGTLVFAAGEVSKTVTIAVKGDTQYEQDERLVVQLSTASFGSSIATNSATTLILNDDAAPPPPIDYTGTAANNTISFATATTGKRLDLSQGGNDTATGGPGDDVFLLGGKLNSTDKINGGLGNDTLALNGDYAGGISLGSSTVTNIETITLGQGNSYKITTNNATVASGGTITIDASTLTGIDSATINGAAESNGRFVFLGGAGNDNFTGGSGADLFIGAAGADTMKGNNGADIFKYLAATDSPFFAPAGTVDGTVIDKITSFQVGTDKIDLAAFGFTGAGVGVITKSTTTFTTNLANPTGYFGTAGVVVEYASVSLVLNTRIYVDANHDGNLGAGDMLIQLTGVAKGSISTSSIIF